ncbi:protein export cytoplasm protein RNA helicase [Francisella sp. W12-1067]|nr:protein export cytoplasm protein RNA helicase [Francisella sp. W12-1067]
MRITLNEVPTFEKIISLYEDSGIIRPVDDFDRIKKMYKNSNLVVCAYEGDELVGIARSLTDFSYCCYLSDLAVSKKYQGKGIGKKIIDYIKNVITPKCTLLLLSSPSAMGFYEKINLDKSDNCFMKRREF